MTRASPILACWLAAVIVTIVLAASSAAQGPFREVYFERLHRESIAAIDFSADGQLLATISLDRTVGVYAWSRRKRLATLTGYVAGDGEGTHDRKVKFLAGDTQILTAQHSGEIQLRQWSTDKLIWKTVTGGRSMAINPAGTTLITADRESPWLRCWNLKSGKLMSELPATHARLSPGSEAQASVAWSRCGKFFASACGGTKETADSTRVVVWNAETFKPRKEFTVANQRAYDLQFSPDSQHLVVGTSAGMVHNLFLGEVPTESADDERLAKLVQQLEDDCYRLREEAQQALQLLGEDERLKLTAALQSAKSLESRTRLEQSLSTIAARLGNQTVLDQAHVGTVVSVAFSQDGRYLASACRHDTPNRGKILVRNCFTGKVMMEINGAGATCVIFSPDNRYLAAAYQDGCVRVWEVSR